MGVFGTRRSSSALVPDIKSVVAVLVNIHCDLFHVIVSLYAAVAAIVVRPWDISGAERIE